MKSSLERIILITLLVLFITGCKKNYVISDKQAILFQLDYVNYAWGYHHNGYIIDNEGNVLMYSDPENWNFPDRDNSITEDKVAENIGRCTLSEIKIPGEDLQKYSKLIRNIASSKITAPINVAADAGSIKYLCYQFSESSGMYKGSLIKMEGDYTCENLNYYAKKVASWMREINNSIPKN